VGNPEQLGRTAASPCFSKVCVQPATTSLQIDLHGGWTVTAAAALSPIERDQVRRDSK